MTPREIWECSNCGGLFYADKNCTCDRPNWNGQASQEALFAAGYRILAPDEFDPASMERAARIAADRGLRAKTIDGQRIGSAIAVAIRSLKGAKP